MMGNVTIKQFTFNPIGEHTYVVSDTTGECVIVDPGCIDAGERKTLWDYVDLNGLKPQGIWLTHLHFDHVWGVKATMERYGAGVWASAADEAWILGNARACALWNLPAPDTFAISHPTQDGETLTFGDTKATVMATPGHSAGSQSFYIAEAGACLTGDTLFRQGVGRTDFPGGDSAAIMESVRGKLLRLPGETRVLPGHGPETTVTEERLYNPYLCAD